jgi:hypothetical protein
MDWHEGLGHEVVDCITINGYVEPDLHLLDPGMRPT